MKNKKFEILTVIKTDRCEECGNVTDDLNLVYSTVAPKKTKSIICRGCLAEMDRLVNWDLWVCTKA